MDELLKSLLSVTAIIIGTGLMLWITNRIFQKKQIFFKQHVFTRALIMMSIVVAGIIGILLTLPIAEGSRTTLMTVMGLVISAAITLSSTTFVGNAMAGFLLRIIRNFRPGDFLRVEEYFGRISEQGLFHTEIQTETSDLITLPNLFIVTHPVTVIRSTGTIISATVSLGYNIPHVLVERTLSQAATEAGLKEPFVQILELGDFSVTYRCAGLLENVRQLIAKRTLLRAKMLDMLHENNIEIVSPTHMNQKRITADDIFIPSSSYARYSSGSEVARGPSEKVVFGKAARAAAIERFRARVKNEMGTLEKLQKDLDETTDETLRKQLGNKINSQHTYVMSLQERLKSMEGATEKE